MACAGALGAIVGVIPLATSAGRPIAAAVAAVAASFAVSWIGAPRVLSTSVAAALFLVLLPVFGGVTGEEFRVLGRIGHSLARSRPVRLARVQSQG